MERERVWPLEALQLLDRLWLMDMYPGAIRGRLRQILGWYPSEQEIRWQAERWNRSAPTPVSRPAKPRPAPRRPAPGPGGFSMLGGRAR